MNKLYTILLLLLPMLCKAQQTIPPTGAGNATSVNLFNGQVYGKNGVRLSSDTAGMRALWVQFLPARVDTGSIAMVNGYFLYYTGSAWVTPAGGGGGSVTSVFGRAGVVTAQSGDYTTSLVTEGSNLYFTNVRADARVAAALINYYTKGQIDSTLGIFLTISSAQATYVPQTRTITINGEAFDLSANRTWEVAGTTAIYGGWGVTIYNLDSVVGDSTKITTRERAKKIGDSVAALIPTNNNQLTNGAGYITSFTELDPLSYHFGDTNGYKQPITRSYGYANFYPLSGNPSGFLTAESDPLSYHYADTNTYKKPASFNYVKDNYYLASNPNNWIGLGAISALSPVAYNNSTGVISMAQSSGSVSGYLSSTDWTTFNNKQPAGTYIQYILNGFAISATGTTSVTVGVDTALMATRLRVQKAVDSLNAVMSAMLAQTTSAASYTGTITPTSTSGNIASTVSYIITAQAGALQFNPPTGSWVNGQILIFRVTDNGTARALTYSTAAGGYRAGTTVTPPSTTVISKTLYLEYMYNSTAGKFDLIGYADGF